MGLRAAGFIWIGGSLGFRFWRVFAREFFRGFQREVPSSYRCRGRRQGERFLGRIKAKTGKRTFVLVCAGRG